MGRMCEVSFVFFFQAEDGIRDGTVTGVQTCALPISWVVAAVGLAMPGLRRAAGRLAAGWRGDTADLDGELLAGFVARLRTLDVDGPRVDAGTRSVRSARARVEDIDAVHVAGAWSLPPAQPWDHPDWVLARAVAAAVIDPDDHLLISATRLDEVPLQQVADRLGISVTVAAGWRRRAEARLAQVIREGDLSGITLDATLRRARAARNAASTTGLDRVAMSHMSKSTCLRATR